jgi:hypothetical protein
MNWHELLHPSGQLTLQLPSALLILIFLVLAPWLAKFQILTPWLYALVVWSALGAFVPDTTTRMIVTCICYLTCILGFSAEACAGASVDFQLEPSADAAVADSKLLAEKWSDVRSYGATGLVLGASLPIPIPPLIWSGGLGIFIVFCLLCYYMLPKQSSKSLETPDKRVYTGRLISICGILIILSAAVWAYGYFETFNPLIMLVVISGLSIPRLLWPLPQPDLSEAESSKQQISWARLGISLCLQVGMPGFTASTGGILFLRRSWLRPALLFGTSMYVEGWSLQMLSHGMYNSKTPLAYIVNRYAPDSLLNRHMLIFVIALTAVIITEFFSKFFSLSKPRIMDSTGAHYRTIGMLLGQSLVAGGPIWTFVFCLVGAIALRISRRFSPASDDNAAIAYLSSGLL